MNTVAFTGDDDGVLSRQVDYYFYLPLYTCWTLSFAPHFYMLQWRFYCYKGSERWCKAAWFRAACRR